VTSGLADGEYLMARSRTQKCTACGAYGLTTTCKQCGAPAQAAAPLKFSPEDPQAARRRQFQKVTDPEWTANLPTTASKGEGKAEKEGENSEEEE
jgi:rRNA maturation protein Nop10